MPGNTSKYFGINELNLIVRAKKASAGTIAAHKNVYITDLDEATGTYLVELAKADSSSTMPSVGVSVDSFDNSTDGSVIIAGTLHGVDTSDFSVGDQLFVSPDTAGAFTATRPNGDQIVEKSCMVLKSLSR